MQVREFLNLPGHKAGAYVIATVQKTTGEEGYIEVELCLADCSRVLDFDFSFQDYEDIANSLHKARLLERTMTDFRKAVEKEADLREKYLNEHPE